MPKTVTLIEGDSIGPEVIQATQKVIEFTEVKFNGKFAKQAQKFLKRTPNHNSNLQTPLNFTSQSSFKKMGNVLGYLSIGK